MPGRYHPSSERRGGRQRRAAARKTASRRPWAIEAAEGGAGTAEPSHDASRAGGVGPNDVAARWRRPIAASAARQAAAARRQSVVADRPQDSAPKHLRPLSPTIWLVWPSMKQVHETLPEFLSVEQCRASLPIRISRRKLVEYIR